MKCNHCGRELKTGYIEDYAGGMCNRFDCFEFGNKRMQEENKRLFRECDQREKAFLARSRIEEQRRLKAIQNPILGCEHSDQINEQQDFEKSLTK